MTSLFKVDMVAEQSVPIGKEFSGDVATYPKFVQRVKADSVKAGLDLETIHREPKLADYVTNLVEEIVGYKVQRSRGNLRSDRQGSISRRHQPRVQA